MELCTEYGRKILKRENLQIAKQFWLVSVRTESELERTGTKDSFILSCIVYRLQALCYEHVVNILRCHDLLEIYLKYTLLVITRTITL